MDYRCVREFNQNVGDIRFVAIFERRRAFRDSYTLPFNTLIAILEDGGSEVSLVENQLTHEVRPYRRYDLLFTPVWLPVLYTSFESLRLIALHFNLFRYPGMDVYNGCRDWIYGHDPAFVRRIEAAFRTEDPLKSLTALRACCLDFCARHWPETEQVDSAELTKMRPVIDWIEAHADARTGISDLADRLSMSPVVFSRKFKTLFGESPKKYLEKTLVNRAIALLANSDCKVKDAAGALGFSSEYYFSSFFRRMVGMYPLEYKKQQLQQGRRIAPPNGVGK